MPEGGVILDLVAVLGGLVVIFTVVVLAEHRFEQRQREAWRRERLEFLQAVAEGRARRAGERERPRLYVVKGGRA